MYAFPLAAGDDGSSVTSSVEDVADLGRAPLMYRMLRALQWSLFLKDFTVLIPQGQGFAHSNFPVIDRFVVA